jgi:hypothetical protein
MKAKQPKPRKTPKLTRETLKDLTAKSGIRAGMKCCMSGITTDNPTGGCSFKG